MHQAHELEQYRGQYLADVVPSFDRKQRMKASLLALGSSVRPRVRSCAADFVSDDVLAVFLCADVLCNDAAAAPAAADTQSALAPDFLGQSVWLAVVFHYASCMLWVKAPEAVLRTALQRRFALIFANDADYFEADAGRARPGFAHAPGGAARRPARAPRHVQQEPRLRHWLQG